MILIYIEIFGLFLFFIENDFDFITIFSLIKSFGNEVLGGGFDFILIRKFGDVLV